MSLVYYGTLMNQVQASGNFLTPYLGSELAFVGGFFRRNPTYTGIVATLRRLSDGSTHDLYFNGENEIDWTDSTLLTFVSGAEVEVKDIYNQFPSANWLVEKVTAPDNRGATLYEGGSFNTLTGKTQKALVFNGSDEYYGGTFTSRSQSTLYMGAVAEASITNFNNNTISYSNSGSGSYYNRVLHRHDILLANTKTASQDSFVAAASTTTNTPTLAGFQEIQTSRVLTRNEATAATNTDSVTFTTGVDAFYVGQLRGNLPAGNYFGGRIAEFWIFLAPKVSERADIESTINLDYGL